MRQAVLLALAVALLLAAPVGHAAAAGASGAPASPSTVVGVHLESNGDAVWTVSIEYRLNDTADRRAFAETASAFESGSAGPSVGPFRAGAAVASNATGRPMRIESASRSHGVENRSDGTALGTLTLRFTWTNFAAVSNGTVEVGDAFAGSWFGDLGPNQTLRLYPPSGYHPESAFPNTQLSNTVLTWQGPQTFSSGGPRAAFVESPGLPWTLIGTLAGVALLVGVAAAYVWRGVGSASEAPADAEAEAATHRESPDAGSPHRESAGAESAESDGGDGSEAPELLSDEERVERLLAENGGRMKQANIVSETRWSDAKVSQLLSGMAEEGRVEKLRLGRENLITLPDEEE